jgi:hypothetical protein
MRAATLVKILSLPPPASSLLLFQTTRSPLPRCSLIEHAQPRFRVRRLRMCTGWNDVNYLSRLDPFNFIARLKTVLLGDCSGYRDLVFRCDLCHFLPLTRTLSLLQLFVQYGLPTNFALQASIEPAKRVRTNQNGDTCPRILILPALETPPRSIIFFRWTQGHPKLIMRLHC